MYPEDISISNESIESPTHDTEIHYVGWYIVYPYGFSSQFQTKYFSTESIPNIQFQSFEFQPFDFKRNIFGSFPSNPSESESLGGNGL